MCGVAPEAAHDSQQVTLARLLFSANTRWARTGLILHNCTKVKAAAAFDRRVFDLRLVASCPSDDAPLRLDLASALTRTSQSSPVNQSAAWRRLVESMTISKCDTDNQMSACSTSALFITFRLNPVKFNILIECLEPECSVINFHRCPAHHYHISGPNYICINDVRHYYRRLGRH